MDVLPTLNNKIAPGEAHSNLKIIFWQQQIETLVDGYHSLLLGRTKAAIVLTVQHISPEPKGFLHTCHFYRHRLSSDCRARQLDWISPLPSACNRVSFFPTLLQPVWLHICLSAIMPAVTTRHGWVLSSCRTGLRVISQISENNALSCLV